MELKLHMDLYRVAQEKKKTFSQLLEEMDPSPEGSSLDAFERQLRKAGIVTKSNYERGINASSVKAFWTTDDNRTLFPEWVARTVRETMNRETILPALLATTTTIEGDIYKGVYIDEQPDRERLRRVTEAAELPRTEIKSRDETVRLYKYGRAIQASYEVIRRIDIPMLAKLVSRISRRIAQDKIAEVVNVILNGDGNDNAAPVLNLTDLDADATPGQLSSVGLLHFLMEFEEFPCDTLVTSKDAFVQIVLSQFPNLTAADVITLLSRGRADGFRMDTPQFPTNTLNLLWTKHFDGNKILGFNRANTIEQITEAGSDIREAAQFVLNQTRALTISETTGYSKIFKEASKVLDLDK